MMHFIGIGGIGMSALAWIALEKGYRVVGSDTKESAILDKLRAKGATVIIGQKKENITSSCSVVYSTAIKEDNPELLRAKELQCPLYHRSELLFEWMQDKKQIVIAGAHGKTTTTSLMIYALQCAHKDPSFVVGGMSRSLGYNGGLGGGEYFVAEGDESDGSFLRTNPFIGIITGMDPDHLDYWKTEKALDKAYEEFIAKTEQLIYCIDDPKLALRAPKGLSYGFSEKADIQLLSFGKQKMTFRFQGEIFRDITLSLAGKHNALNSLALFGACHLLGIDNEVIFQAMATFEGVDRRMQVKGSIRGVTYVDDYAHHPKEVEATLQAMRTKVEEGNLVVVFQPHRFSRFHSFLKEFAEALRGEESLVITDIYGAGEENTYHVDAQDLIALLANKRVFYAKRNDLKHFLPKITKEGDTVLAMGAGDITYLAEELV